MLAQRRELYDATTEASLLDLADLAAQFCDAEVRQVDVGYTARGDRTLIGNRRGWIASGTETFVFDDFDAFTVSDAIGYRTAAAPTGTGCLGYGGSVAEHTVHVMGYETTTVSVEGSGMSLRVVDRATQSEQCSLETAGVVSLAGGSSYDIYVMSDSPESVGTFQLVVIPSEQRTSSMLVWTQGLYSQIPVSVTGYYRDAYDLDSYCYGYIPDAPTVRIQIDFEGYAELTVESSSDPILLVQGPDDYVYCNDDYYGLNPGLYQYWYPGIYDVYVGSYSPGDVFEATLNLW